MHNAKGKKGYRDFVKALREGFENNLLFLTGNEQYLSKWACDAVVNKYVKAGAQLMDMAELDEESMTFQLLEEALEVLPLISERRVVILNLVNGAAFRGIENKLLELFNSVKSKDGNILIVRTMTDDEVKIDAKLKKVLTSYSFERLDRRDLRGFLMKQIRTRGISLSQDALMYLIDISGYYNKDSDYRLLNFMTDLDKLKGISERGDVKREEIEQLIFGDQEDYIFAFLDAMMTSRRGTAMTIFNNMYEGGEDFMRLLGLLTSQLELALSMKELEQEGLPIGQIARLLSASEFRLKKIKPLLNASDNVRLKRLLLGAYGIERNVKTGLLSSRMAMEYYIGTM